MLPPNIRQEVALHNPRAKRLWDLYRLTEEQFDTVMAFQGGVCAISGRLPGATRLNIDHDHKTGELRGLLSPWVNKGLSFFEDDPYLLRRAALYLENPPVRAALGHSVFGLIGRAQRKKKM